MKARDIHDRLKKNYAEFKEVQQMLSTIQPQVVTQNIREQVSQFFKNLRRKLDDSETEVMKLIKGSKNLKAFLEKSESLQDSVNDDIVGMIEEENTLVS